MLRRSKPTLTYQRWSWSYSCGDSEVVWAWAFLHISLNFQYLSECIFFPRLLEGPICGTCIEGYWGEVMEVLENLASNRLMVQLQKCGLLLYFQYGFRSSWSTANILKYVSDRTARAFNRHEPMPDVALNIFKALYRVWNAGLFNKLKACVCYFLKIHYTSDLIN